MVSAMFGCLAPMKGFLSVFEDNWAASRVSRDLLLPGGSSSQCEAQRLEVQGNSQREPQIG